ncbi:MAG: PAS domain-containing protein [Lachnospiraceae bacterium]|nr:PAS domain-containing protein [Ruminococcus sp.]MCM1275105.1 PAS domain-containing protein [Lachnospiraceae bacterium]
MAEFLKLKKSNCKNCYKCIRHCPVKSIRFSGNQANIVGDECILCGQCFVVCPQNAKEIADSTERVKYFISSGEKVYASVAPSFVANYDGAGIEALTRALRELGFAGAEETAVGATIVKTEYERLIREDKRDVLISSCCNSVNLLIQKYYPEALEYLADVLSPMQAHCRDLKKRFPGCKTVFIGPCVSKKEEAARYADYTDDVLTFEELTNWLNEAGVKIDKSVDSNERSRARLFPTSGGVLRTMAERDPNYTYLVFDGMDNVKEALEEIVDGKLHNCFIEMSACAGSCANGPVMEKYKKSPVASAMAINKYAGKEDFVVSQPDKSELHKKMTMLDTKAAVPTESEVADILRRMGKTRPEQELNCGSCGYNTCREKAVAIYRGKADISMCLPFLKDKAESFSDNIISNSPNAIFALNENLEIQQINKTALKLMNIARVSDVMGEQVIRILDPGVFMEVMETNKPVHDERKYLTEYDKYVEQTVIYDAEYRIIICIMRDVTEDEKAKVRKENVGRTTAEVADKVVENQMRIVQEIASLLGETAAETKVALMKLKESINDE